MTDDCQFCHHHLNAHDWGEDRKIQCGVKGCDCLSTLVKDEKGEYFMEQTRDATPFEKEAILAMQRIQERMTFGTNKEGNRKGYIDGREVDRVVFGGHPNNEVRIFLKPKGMILIHHSGRISVSSLAQPEELTKG